MPFRVSGVDHAEQRPDRQFDSPSVRPLPDSDEFRYAAANQEVSDDAH